jgi:hypothetical protein
LFVMAEPEVEVRWIVGDQAPAKAEKRASKEEAPKEEFGEHEDTE